MADVDEPHPIGIRRRPTLPGRVQPSTIGAEGLNFCVRDGNRWDPFAIATGNTYLRMACALRACPCSWFLPYWPVPRRKPLVCSFFAWPARFALAHALRPYLRTLTASQTFGLLLLRIACASLALRLRTLTTAHEVFRVFSSCPTFSSQVF